MEMNGKKIDNVARAVRYLESNGYIMGIERKQVPIEMGEALEIVTAIGKKLEPRFVIDNSNRTVYENVLLWLHGDSSAKCQDPTTTQWRPVRLNKGLYICGMPGTGKTMMMDVLRLYSRAMGISFKSGGYDRTMAWENARTDYVVDRYAENGNAKEYKGKPNVCFQDLGTEPKEAMYMGNRLELMRNVIEDRGDNHSLMTHFTSNIPIGRLDRMKTIYGDRVVSRLFEMCNYFELLGNDRRKQ